MGTSHDTLTQESSVAVETGNRGLPVSASWDWLKAGWRDLTTEPASSLAYGLVIAALSIILITALFLLALDYILFPAIAAFMVVGPLVAIGLYEKSRQLEAGRKINLRQMIFVHPESGGQVLFAGVILCGLALLWMRAAVIIYALFFGLQPFPGLDRIAPMLFTTPVGWALLITGSAVGGVFAAFSFAVSVFSIPMMLDRKTDVFTAIGISISRVWNNLPVMIGWGLIVLVLTAFSLATGMIGMIVVFPLLGHASWHAYRAIV